MKSPPEQVQPDECCQRDDYFIPSEGTSHTPAHPMLDFHFRDYGAKIFRYLREKFGIDHADYLVCHLVPHFLFIFISYWLAANRSKISLTGDYTLSEIVSPGKSGSFFYFSHDTRFMLKTITKSEKQFLLKILHHYYEVESKVVSFFPLLIIILM